MIKKNKSFSLNRKPAHSFEHLNKIDSIPYKYHSNETGQIKQLYRPIYFGILDFLVPLIHPEKKQIELKISETTNNTITFNEKISLINKALTDELISNENKQDLIIEHSSPMYLLFKEK